MVVTLKKVSLMKMGPAIPQKRPMRICLMGRLRTPLSVRRRAVAGGIWRCGREVSVVDYGLDEVMRELTFVPKWKVGRRVDSAGCNDIALMILSLRIPAFHAHPYSLHKCTIHAVRGAVRYSYHRKVDPGWLSSLCHLQTRYHAKV